MSVETFGNGTDAEVQVLNDALQQLVPMCKNTIGKLALMDQKSSPHRVEAIQFVLVGYSNLMTSLGHTVLHQIMSAWIKEAGGDRGVALEKAFAHAKAHFITQYVEAANDYLAVNAPGTRLVVECRVEGGF